MRKDAEKIVKLLSKETLLRITGHEFDRRLIHPVLIEANMLMENVNAEMEDEDMNLDTAVNQVLDNKKEMFMLMSQYCL